MTSQEFHILALTHSLPAESAIQKSLKSKCFTCSIPWKQPPTFLLGHSSRPQFCSDMSDLK